MPVFGREKAGSSLAPLAQLAWDYHSSLPGPLPLLVPHQVWPLAPPVTGNSPALVKGCGSDIDGQIICGLLSS